MNINDFQALSNACRNIRSQLGVLEKAFEKERVEFQKQNAEQTLQEEAEEERKNK